MDDVVIYKKNRKVKTLTYKFDSYENFTFYFSVLAHSKVEAYDVSLSVIKKHFRDRVFSDDEKTLICNFIDESSLETVPIFSGRSFTEAGQLVTYKSKCSIVSHRFFLDGK